MAIQGIKLTTNDIANLNKAGKIYASKNDRDNGNSINVNTEYFGDNGSELYRDDQGRIVEIQTDGTKVYMGWTDNDNVNPTLNNGEPGGVGRNASTGDINSILNNGEPGGVGHNASTGNVKQTGGAGSPGGVGHNASTGNAQQLYGRANAGIYRGAASNSTVSTISTGVAQDLTDINSKLNEYNTKTPQDLTDINSKVNEYNSKKVAPNESWSKNSSTTTDSNQQLYGSANAGTYRGAASNSTVSTISNENVQNLTDINSKVNEYTTKKPQDLTDINNKVDNYTNRYDNLNESSQKNSSTTASSTQQHYGSANAGTYRGATNYSQINNISHSTTAKTSSNPLSGMWLNGNKLYDKDNNYIGFRQGDILYDTKGVKYNIDVKDIPKG